MACLPNRQRPSPPIHPTTDESFRSPRPPTTTRESVSPITSNRLPIGSTTRLPDNPITDHGATLGRVLFYDGALSVDGSTSCASCHLQEFAFTDDKKRSVGFRGAAVRRNSMSLINLRYYPRGRFFWDERAESLEAQVLMPIEDPIEMGHRLRRFGAATSDRSAL